MIPDETFFCPGVPSSLAQAMATPPSRPPACGWRQPVRSEQYCTAGVTVLAVGIADGRAGSACRMQAQAVLGHAMFALTTMLSFDNIPWQMQLRHSAAPQAPQQETNWDIVGERGGIKNCGAAKREKERNCGVAGATRNCNKAYHGPTHIAIQDTNLQ
eukprot:gene17402-biopygen12877